MQSTTNNTDSQLPTKKSFCSRITSDESHIDNKQKLENLSSLDSKLQKLTIDQLRKETVVTEKRCKQSDVKQQQNRLSNVQTEFMNESELLLPLKKRARYCCYQEFKEKVRTAVDNDNEYRLPSERSFCSRINTDSHIDDRQKKFLNKGELLLPVKKRARYRCYQELKEKQRAAVDNDNEYRLPSKKSFCSDDSNIDFKQKRAKLPTLESRKGCDKSISNNLKPRSRRMIHRFEIILPTWGETRPRSSKSRNRKNRHLKQ